MILPSFRKCTSFLFRRRLTRRSDNAEAFNHFNIRCQKSTYGNLNLGLHKNDFATWEGENTTLLQDRNLSVRLTMALFSFMFKALFSKKLEPFSSSSEYKSGSSLHKGLLVKTIALFPLLDLRSGNFIATFRGSKHFCGLFPENVSSSLMSLSPESSF